MTREDEVRSMVKQLGVFVNQNLAIFTRKDKDTREMIKRCESIAELYKELTVMVEEHNGEKVDLKLVKKGRKFEGIDKTECIKYSKTYEPFDHQAEYFNLTKEKTFFANFAEMGLGKTIMEIMTSGYLYERGLIKAMVIIAPNGVHRQWINEALPEHLPDRFKPITAIWSSKANKMERIALDSIFVREGGLKVLTINIESFGRKQSRSYEYVKLFMEKHKCMLIIDESTKIKSKDAECTTKVLKLGKLCEFKRILSGLYIPNGPLDLFSQFLFLNAQILGFSSYVAFKARYAVEVNPKLKRDLEIATGIKELAEKIYNERRRQYINPARLKQIIGYDLIEEKPLIFKDTWNILRKSFLFVAGYKNIEELGNKIRPYSFRVLKEECLDLPEKLFQQYETTMSNEQMRMYNEIRDNLITEIEGEELTAQHILTKLGFLRQICGGTYRVEGKKPGEMIAKIIPGIIPRMETMMEVIGNISNNKKIIIWGFFRAEVEMIRQRIANEYGPDCYSQIHGGITGQNREDQIDRFKTEGQCRFLLGTASSGGIGRNLTAASYMIFYSNSMDLGERRQAEDRIHRISMTGNVTIIDFFNPGLIDEKLFKSFIIKQSLANQITKDKFIWLPLKKREEKGLL